MIVRPRLRVGALSVASVALIGVLAACGSGAAPEQSESAGPALVVYSGRSEELVAPLIESFEQESGVDVEVRYGSTAEMAAQILEEGDGSPAELYFSQDAGARQSLEDQRRIELADDVPFETYRRRYLDQELLSGPHFRPMP